MVHTEEGDFTHRIKDKLVKTCHTLNLVLVDMPTVLTGDEA